MKETIQDHTPEQKYQIIQNRIKAMPEDEVREFLTTIVSLWYVEDDRSVNPDKELSGANVVQEITVALRDRQLTIL